LLLSKDAHMLCKLHRHKQKDRLLLKKFNKRVSTCGKMERISIWKIVLATLNAMSGRMLKRVLPNS
jgi:hypothetical protein